jgi:hypothetical protein
LQWILKGSGFLKALGSVFFARRVVLRGFLEMRSSGMREVAIRWPIEWIPGDVACV